MTMRNDTRFWAWFERGERHWAALSPEQASMIVSCVANNVPLCCERGQEALEVILPGARNRAKRRYFNEWAYQSTGCEGEKVQMTDVNPGRTERWLNAVLDMLKFQPVDMHDEVLAWEARRIIARNRSA